MPKSRNAGAKSGAAGRASPREPAYARTHKLSGKRLQFLLKAEDEALRERAESASSGRAAKTLVTWGSAVATAKLS